jgi:cytochrome c-type biogenesis protein CcmH/NrfG
MNAIVVSAALAAMFSVVLFGAVAPYRHASVPAFEPPADPLEDRRLALLVSLKDLQSSRDAGAIDAEEYLRLRDDTETRMAKVLRAIDERKRREDEGPDVARPRRSPARYLAIAMVAAIALSIGVVPSLLRSLKDRTSTDDVTISLPGLRARVQQNPHDPAALLDYAHGLLDAGQFGGAFEQFTAVLSLQPRNVDALANYGLLLRLSGRPLDGLKAENEALRIDPTYGEALFYKGTILLQSLDRPAEAIVYLQRYLDGNPTGSYNGTARGEIRKARAEIAAGPTPTPSAPVPTPQLTVPTG